MEQFDVSINHDKISAYRIEENPRKYEIEFFDKYREVITPLARIASKSYWFDIDNPQYKPETIQRASLLPNGRIEILTNP